MAGHSDFVIHILSTSVIMFTILTTWRLPDKKSSAQFQIDLLSSGSFKAGFEAFIMLKVELCAINQYTHPSICINSSRAVCKARKVVSYIDLFVQYATAEGPRIHE